MHLSGLFLYPVKSLRGIAVRSAEIDELGIVGDRRFMIVDENGRHLTQRPLPRMALITAELSGAHLTLQADGMAPVSVPLRAGSDAEIRTVSIWRSAGLRAEDCGEEVAAWLSSFLGVQCRLVRIGDAFRRPVLLKPRDAGALASASAQTVEGRIVSSDLFHFADGYPFLAISEASLSDLNDRLIGRGEESVPTDRFRPNLVISGCAAFAEDRAARLKVGEIILRSGGPSSRCIVTTTDQITGERSSPEPLRTLATYRRDAVDPTDVNFGQNFIHETKRGRLAIGDPVTTCRE